MLIVSYKEVSILQDNDSGASDYDAGQCAVDHDTVNPDPIENDDEMAVTVINNHGLFARNAERLADGLTDAAADVSLLCGAILVEAKKLSDAKKKDQAYAKSARK